MTAVNPNSPSAPWSAMDLDLLRRVRKSALVFGVVLAIVFATYFGVRAGVAWFAGVAWSLVNLYFITSVVTRVLTLEDRKLRGIILALAVKFPVLYAAGFMLLKLELPALWLVAGFTWPFFVIVMKGAGRAYLKMDEGGRSERPAS